MSQDRHEPDWEPENRSQGWKWINETTECWWQGNQWSLTFRDHPPIPIHITNIEETEDGLVAYGDFDPEDKDRLKQFISDHSLELSIYTRGKHDQEDHHVS